MVEQPKLHLPLTTPGQPDEVGDVEELATSFTDLLRQTSGGELPAGLSLEWADLNFTINGKQILKDVCGCVKHGRFTAVLGPSGSGKSTLLNLLAGRQRFTGPGGKAPFSGTVSVSGTPIDVMAYRSNIAYVMQDDSLLATETPRECIRLSAQLRLGGRSQDHEALVDSMLSTLGLTKCSNTIVGSALLKGISGGERKRTSVGVELVTSPKMFFLDEPLSGLDSYAAFTLTKALKELAQAGVPVLCTVHQPSSEIFAMFNDVIILHDGEVVYHGPVSLLAGHFGQWEACPLNFNPADHVMFLLQKEAEELRPRILEMKMAWKASGLHKEMMRWQEDLGQAAMHRVSTGSGNPSPAQCVVVEEGRRRQGFFGELAVLTAREYRAIVRNKGVLAARLGMSIFLAGLYAWLFAGSAGAGDDPSQEKSCLPLPHFNPSACSADFQAQFGTLVSLAISSMMGAAQPILLTFPNERPVFLREYAAKQYGVVPYFLSKTFMEMPVVLLTQLITWVISYWIMGLHGSFMILVLVSWALGLASSSLGLVVGCAVSSAQKAIQLAPLALIPQMLFSGLFLPIQKIPPSLRWVQHVCPLKYAIDLTALTEFNYVRKQIAVCEDKESPVACAKEHPGDYLRQELLQNQGVEWDDWSTDLIVLVALFVGFRVIATFLLWRKGKYVF